MQIFQPEKVGPTQVFPNNSDQDPFMSVRVQMLLLGLAAHWKGSATLSTI